MTYKLYTVGSNQILADELKDALTSILQDNIPVPYASLSEEVLTHYLSEAEYIIGVDRILDAVLWSEKYREYLRENVMTIGAKRVVSIESTCNIIKKVNETLFDYFTVQLDELLVSFHQAKHGETLYTHFKELEQRLCTVREPLCPEKTPYKDKNMESIILRSAMSQLVANRDV